jgi:diguanylate cyclase (GGDEF)-like protein/PAS domain S-box-containing protein
LNTVSEAVLATTVDQAHLFIVGFRPSERQWIAAVLAMRTKITEPGQEALAREAIRRESAATFHRLAEAVGSAIFICEGEQLRYVNHAAETITEYRREELLTMNFGELLCPGSGELLGSRGPMHQEDAESAPQGELKILTKNGAERCLDATAATIEFDGVSTTLISAFDITECKRAEARAQLLAMTDPLTGLGNYRRILDVLNAEIERSGRTGRSFALLLLDLDGLKEINDRYGHLVGSRALCRLGGALRICCRAIDTVARYGGDEFSVILPETTVEAAGVVASRIREELAKDGQPPPLSISMGVVAYPQDGETIETLLQTADRKLYGMKSRDTDKPSSSVHSRMISPAEPGSPRGLLR